jgi:hypothetical protein
LIFVFVGIWKNNLASGVVDVIEQYVSVVNDTNTVIAYYNGSTNIGVKNGYGFYGNITGFFSFFFSQIVWIIGDYYVGSWVNGTESNNGYGRVTYDNYDIFVGRFLDHNRSSFGYYSSSNGFLSCM